MIRKTRIHAAHAKSTFKSVLVGLAMGAAAPALFAAAVTVVAVPAPAEAREWKRERSVTGPYGGSRSVQGSGSCSGGHCGSSQTWTGRYGNSVNREGSTGCADGSCSGGATYTGPGGQSATRSRSLQVN